MFEFPTVEPTAKILYKESGPITAVKGNVVTTIDVSDEMHFEMDIAVNSIRDTTWESIFHCGSANGIRVPGIWLHPEADDDGATHEGIHVTFDNKESSNFPYPDTPAMGDHLTAGNTYHLEIDVSQTMLRVEIDGEVVFEDNDVAEHYTYTDLPCYVSDPWYNAADVMLYNLLISNYITSPTTAGQKCWRMLSVGSQ